MDYVTVAYDDPGRDRALGPHAQRPATRAPAPTCSTAWPSSPRSDLVYVTGESAAPPSSTPTTSPSPTTSSTAPSSGSSASPASANKLGPRQRHRRLGRRPAVLRHRRQLRRAPRRRRRDRRLRHRRLRRAHGAQQWVARYGGPAAGFNAAIPSQLPATRSSSPGRAAVPRPTTFATTGPSRTTRPTATRCGAPGTHPHGQMRSPSTSPCHGDGQTAFVTGSSGPAVPYTDLDEAVTVAYRTSDGDPQWVSSLSAGPLNAVLGRTLARRRRRRRGHGRADHLQRRPPRSPVAEHLRHGHHPVLERRAPSPATGSRAAEPAAPPRPPTPRPTRARPPRPGPKTGAYYHLTPTPEELQ